MTKRILFLGLAAALTAGAAAEPAAAGRRFEWTTTSTDAKKGLLDLQQRIEAFQVGAETIEAARKMAADPEFAMGVYYLSAVTPPPDNETHLERAVVLSKRAWKRRSRTSSRVRWTWSPRAWNSRLPRPWRHTMS